MIFFFCILSLTGTAQAVLFINAGSRALTGNQQELIIDAKGNGRYYLREVNGPVKDSVIFNISTEQLQSFFSKAEASGFFNLNNEYKGKAVDGAGIYISMNSNGKKNHIEMTNMDLPVINELIIMLNSMLVIYHIRINYGQFVNK